MNLPIVHGIRIIILCLNPIVHIMLLYYTYRSIAHHATANQKAQFKFGSFEHHMERNPYLQYTEMGQ